jgi:outer membrane immunogenic protein
MKTLTTSLIALFAGAILALTSFAGPEPIRDYKDSKDSKVVASVPPPCDWHGFYMGLHAGGEFGTSDNIDFDGYNSRNRHWSFDESGIVAGGQLGYNWQWHMLVFGPEVDLGYMHLNGHGVEPTSPNGDTRGITDSDFYTTIRARIGVALNCNWLIYATGGGIGVNYDTRVLDNSIIQPGPGLIDAHNQEMEWGYTAGAGVERKLGPHWSIKLEYLYFNLADQTFSGVSSGTRVGQVFSWNSDTDGHIVRGGVNFHF